jgi:hypothetical protein
MRKLKKYLTKVLGEWEIMRNFMPTTDNIKTDDLHSNQYLFYISAAGVHKHWFSCPWLFNSHSASGINFFSISSLFNNNHR